MKGDHTSWDGVKKRISRRSTENILKAAEFHIAGLEWFVKELIKSGAELPWLAVRDITIKALLDTTKVSIKDRKKAIQEMADGIRYMEFRGVVFPKELTIRAGRYFLGNYDSVIKQDADIQASLEKAREEQGGSNLI